MAGPYHLAPGQEQATIPTWGFGRKTRVIVTNNSTTTGKISMRGGLSFWEQDEVHLGTTNFDRDFGGVFLIVSNDGTVPLTVSTQ
jgi:hypothetical protein